MKRTSPVALLIAALLGAGVGFLLDTLLTARGQATFTPAYTMPIVLVLLAAIVVVLALPVRRAAKGGTPVDPFRAVRIAMLAKASSLVGAVLAGFATGLAAFLMSRPVSPPLGSMAPVLVTVACGVVLIGAALVAEHLCTIRKDDDDEPPGLESGAH